MRALIQSEGSCHLMGDTRPWLELPMGNDEFRPRKFVTKIGEIVFKKLEVGAYQWKRITPCLKEQMFKEFKNQFRWDLSDEDLTLEVKRRFMKKAPTLYKGRIYKLIQLYLEKNPKPANITDDVWNTLVCHWKTEEAAEAFRKAKKNRLSEVEPGEGISKTFGGSYSFAEMAVRLVEENEGEEISLDKLYMHTRTKDGEWADIRSKKIYVSSFFSFPN